MSYRKDWLKRYNKIFKGFKKNFWIFIKYQIVAKLLVSIVLFPIFKELFKLILESKGLNMLLNGIILKFFLSPQGFLSIILIIIFATLVLLIEYGGLIVISYESYSNKPSSSLFNILKLSIKRFKNLIGFGGLIILLYTIIIFPWLDMGYHTSLLTSLKIPNFIQEYIKNNNVLYTVMKTVTILILPFSIGWIFSIEIIMLENKSAIKAVKKSFHMVKNNIKLVVINLLITIISIVIVTLGLYSSIAMSFPMFSLTNSFTNILVNGAILFLGFIIYFVSFLIIPYVLHHFTYLYLSINNTPIDLSMKTRTKKPTIVDKIFNNKKIIRSLIVLSFILVMIITKFILDDLDNTHYNVKVTAHRGSSIEAPENTIAAIDKAIENKTDFVEIDVQETKDGIIVVYHDKNLKRITGLNETIYNLYYDEIKNIDVGSWFSDDFAGERIPTLQEVIDYSRGKISLNIELKPVREDKDFVKKVVDIINRNNLVDSCVITSLDYDVLKEVEKLNSKIKTGYIMFIVIGDINFLQDVDFYSVEESYIDENFVLKAHLINREVHVWTVNETEKMKEFIEMGVDNIITDYDEELVKIIKNYN